VPPQGVTPRNFVKMFDAYKTRMIGLPYGEKTMTILSRFHPIPERYGHTDGQTDKFAMSISRVSVLTRDKNHVLWSPPFPGAANHPASKGGGAIKHPSLLNVPLLSSDSRSKL